MDLIVRPFFEEFFRQIRRVVVYSDVITVVGHVEGQVTAHNSHADDANIMKHHKYIPFSAENDYFDFCWYAAISANSPCNFW